MDSHRASPVRRFEPRRSRSRFMILAIGPGLEISAAVGAEPESDIKRSAVAAHASQMYARRPATSFATCDALLPQNEQANLPRNSIDRPSNPRRRHVSRDHY
jgi:hypothetical protein